MNKYVSLILLGSNITLLAIPGLDSITDMLPGWKEGVNITEKMLGIKKEAHVHLSLSHQECALALLKLDADAAEPLLTKEQRDALVTCLIQGILQKQKAEPKITEDAKQE